jgi:hypothetical protein
VVPQTTAQTCIVHLIRNSLAFISWKDRYLLEDPQGDRWIALAPFGLELFEPKERSPGPRTLRWRRRNTVHRRRKAGAADLTSVCSTACRSNVERLITLSSPQHHNQTCIQITQVLDP